MLIGSLQDVTDKYAPDPACFEGTGDAIYDLVAHQIKAGLEYAKLSHEAFETIVKQAEPCVPKWKCVAPLPCLCLRCCGPSEDCGHGSSAGQPGHQRPGHHAHHEVALTSGSLAHASFTAKNLKAKSSPLHKQAGPIFTLWREKDGALHPLGHAVKIDDFGAHYLSGTGEVTDPIEHLAKKVTGTAGLSAIPPIGQGGRQANPLWDPVIDAVQQVGGVPMPVGDEAQMRLRFDGTVAPFDTPGRYVVHVKVKGKRVEVHPSCFVVVVS